MSDWDVLSIIHGKLLGCSNDAVATFWRVVTWARGPGAHARPGFVNAAQLKALSGGVSAKRLVAVTTELQDAGKPQHAHGLLDPAEGGWWIHDFEHYGRAVDIVAPLAPVPVEPRAAATPRAVSAARAAAGRAGGLRSAAARLASKQTAQPPKPTVEAKGGFASTAPKQNPEANLGSSFGSGSRSDLEIREIHTENPLPKDLTGIRAGEVCFEEDEFPDLGVGERAQLIAADERLALSLKPHRWTEVIDIAKAFAQATGIPRNVAAYDRDGGVRAAVALLAVFEPEAILRAIPVATKTDWWKAQPGRPLAHLSITVVEDALGRDAAAARADAERRRRLAGSVVPRKAAAPVPAGENAALALAALARVQ